MLETLVLGTELELVLVPADAETGLIDRAALAAEVESIGDRLAAIVFPQVNTFGLVEDVDALTEVAASVGAEVGRGDRSAFVGPSGAEGAFGIWDKWCGHHRG